jgi:putative endonuclease
MLHAEVECLMDPHEFGRRAEDAAAAYLERKGLTILERNWRSEAGEIDIISLDGESVVFVEVKARQRARSGAPEEAVSERKQRRLGRVAIEYLAKAGLDDVAARFDVVAITRLTDDRARLRYHRNAFEAPE